MWQATDMQTAVYATSTAAPIGLTASSTTHYGKCFNVQAGDMYQLIALNISISRYSIAVRKYGARSSIPSTHTMTVTPPAILIKSMIFPIKSSPRASNSAFSL